MELLLMNDDLCKLNLKDKPKGLISRLVKEKKSKTFDRSCLFLFTPEGERHEYVNSCLSFANLQGNFDDLVLNLEGRGNACVKYRVTADICEASRVIIENFIRDRLPVSGIIAKWLRSKNYFLKKLSCVLVLLIEEMSPEIRSL
ncbi:hypothetical protein RF11_04911 [Thelohanellus kitauei]|uniref:Uncharacterized protein n=1 Tax=Thelohanellus kitauei TaxID=669202 RepID=A0A0C2JYY1_THEKT|nr:hypothetical protein RF11_04911 [Thelohanellus kitauei]